MNAAVKDIQRPEKLLLFSKAPLLPMIIQSEVAECGLACLAMVAGYHGFQTTLTNLRHEYPVSSRGATLKDVMAIAARLKFATRALRGEINSLNHLQLPCILHWNLNHFVVLKKITKNKYVLHDPSIGERYLDKAEFSREFTGVILELTPTPEFKKRVEKDNLKISHFWSGMVGFKRSILQIVIISLALQLFNIASPFYLQTVVDDVLLRQDSNLLTVLALGFLFLLVIQAAVSALRSYVVLYLSNRLAIQMSANLFRHLIRLPMDYFAKRHMGDLVSRFGALSFVRSTLTDNFVSAVVDGVMASITLLVMFLYDARLAGIVILAVILYFALRWAFYYPAQSLTQASIVASARENTHFMETMRAIQTIKLFQRENDRQSEWLHRLADVMNKNIQLARWNIGFSALNGILFGVENILVIYFAATSVMTGVMSLGMLYGFISYKTSFKGAMDRLIMQWINFKMLDLYLNRLADIAFTEPENIDEHLSIGDTPEHSYLTAISKHPEVLKGKIEVRNLSYRYSEHEAPIFSDLNFTIHPGEAVLITGPSGCGKTTLLKCLMGLISPTTGEIFIDDKPLAKVPYYRSNIASVMQEDQLLTGDIMDNIACFRFPIDPQKIYTCARAVRIHREIMRMPMQYHTLVGDMGSSLSGGQKQRLVLARALYREPQILFMDEATSNLDVTNEYHITENIKKMNITRVQVSHRPEASKSADKIIQLNVPTQTNK